MNPNFGVLTSYSTTKVNTKLPCQWSVNMRVCETTFTNEKGNLLVKGQAKLGAGVLYASGEYRKRDCFSYLKTFL